MALRGKAAALGAALALVSQPSAVRAQDCVTEGQAAALVAYALLHAVEGVRFGCSGSLSASGFVATEGGVLSSRYMRLQDRSWPQARSALLRIVTGETRDSGRDNAALLSILPERNLRPLVNSLIVQKVRTEIEPGQCGRAERLLEAVAPIEPEVVTNLVGVIAGLAKIEDLQICTGSPA